MNEEIKIIPINKDIIEFKLHKVQRINCKNKLSYMDIEEATKKAELMIEPYLKKQDRQNIIANVKPEYPAYYADYPDGAKHTHCYIRRGRKFWYLYGIERVDILRSGSETVVFMPEPLELKRTKIFNYVTKTLIGD
jgi:hypothetical protein